jgi:hypothetical protein
MIEGAFSLVSQVLCGASKRGSFNALLKFVDSPLDFSSLCTVAATFCLASTRLELSMPVIWGRAEPEGTNQQRSSMTADPMIARE